jgi:predicted GNAT superfamily acetyltransferase
MYVASVLSGVAYVVSVCCKCFIYFRRMLQQMLYVASVSSASAARGRRQGWSPDPLGRSSFHVCAGSQAGATASAGHKDVSMGVAVDVKHEAASMLGCSLSLFLFQIDAAGQQQHHAPAVACKQ